MLSIKPQYLKKLIQTGFSFSNTKAIKFLLSFCLNFYRVSSVSDLTHILNHLMDTTKK